MANEKRIKLTNVKCPTCKVTLLVKPSVKICPACRGPLPKLQKVDRVDYELAKAWHKTAVESKKAGKDSSDALKKAGASLEGAAKWSGNKRLEGARASVDAVTKVGTGAAKGVKAGSEEVEKWVKDIGDGVEHLGRKL